MFSLASSALSGTLFLSGYFSKDFIIDVCGFDTFLGNFVYFMCLMTVAITAIYTMGDDDDADEEYDRNSFMLRTQSDVYNLHEEFWEGQKQFYSDSVDVGPLSTLSTAILLIVSLSVGFLFFDFLVGVGSNLFSGSSYLYNNTSIVTENAVLLETVILSFALSFIVGLVAVDNWNVNLHFFRLGFTKLYWDKFVNWLSAGALYSFYYAFLVVDKGILEYIGPFTSAVLSSKFAHTFVKVQTGLTASYFLFIVVSFFLIVALIDVSGLLWYVGA